jgi:CopG family transcriptional regulator, nickel-responsive regulator
MLRGAHARRFLLACSHSHADGAIGRFTLGLVFVNGGAGMGKLVRTGVSLEGDLLAAFDKAIAKKGYANRSEAIRDLIRDHLVDEDIDKNKVVVGTLTIVYDHHRPNLTEKLVSAQHHAGGTVLAATHVHMDHHNCLEVVIMKGRSGALRDLANNILALRGVKHGQLVVTSTGKDLK